MSGTNPRTAPAGSWDTLLGRSDETTGPVDPDAGIRSLILVVLVVGSAPVVGCDGGSAPGIEQVARDTTAGRATVANPPEPVREPDGPPRPELLWTEPVRVDPGPLRSWHPEPEIRAAAAGVVISVPGAGALTVRSARTGAVEQVIEPSGEGEGALDSLFAVAVTDSLIAAGDRDGIELFRYDGEPGGRLAVGGRLMDLYGAGGRGVVAEIFDGSGLRWLRYADAGSDGRRYPGLPASAATRPGANRLGCWKKSGDAVGMVIGSCAYPVLLEVNHDGRVTREITVDVPPDSASEAELDAVREEVASQVEAAEMEPTPDALEAMQDREARRHALVKRYRGGRRDPVTGRIALLEQVPDYMGGGEATVHLFDADGVYRARLEFGEFWYDFDVRDGRLFVLRRASTDGDDGRVEVAAYSLRADR